jgi:hypothetical protein
MRRVQQKGKTMTNLFVCLNVETLVDGTWLQDHSDRFAIEGIWDITKNFYNKNTVFDDYNFDNHFSHWHGGKFDQFFKRCGFVAVPNNSSEEIVTLAWELSREIAQEVEKQALEEFLDACRYWANELESGNIELDEFKQKVADELLDNAKSYDTVDEILVELRRR